MSDAVSTLPVDGGCKSGVDIRSSDLCAQWKAADAAADSAFWSAAASVASVISVVGVLAALGLALQSNNIARVTAKRQLRAYVSVSKVYCSQYFVDLPLKTQMTFVNTGQTPALDVALIYAVAFRYDVNSIGFEIFPESDAVSRSVWGPGVTNGIEFENPDPLDMHDSTLVTEGGGAIYAWGICYYSDIFGERHQTEFRYALGGKYRSPGTGDMIACEEGNRAN